MTTMHEQLEGYMTTIPSSGEPHEIPLDLLAGPVVEFRHRPIEDDAGEADTLAPVVEIIALGDFSAQWGMMHDMMGGMVQMRTGHPCPLGDQARSEGGRVACEAAYKLIESNPALSRLILSPNSSFFGQLAAIGMHGFTCVQVVKSSRNGETSVHEFQEDAA